MKLRNECTGNVLSSQNTFTNLDDVEKLFINVGGNFVACVVLENFCPSIYAHLQRDTTLSIFVMGSQLDTVCVNKMLRPSIKTSIADERFLLIHMACFANSAFFNNKQISLRSH